MSMKYFVASCLAIAASFALFDIVTPELTFTSVNCTHINWPRSAKRNNNLIAVDLWFAEIPVNALAAFSNTAQPGEAGGKSLGLVQTSDPSAAISNGFSSGGAYTLY